MTALPFSIGDAEGVRSTDRALLVRVGKDEIWIPQSVIHEDSEVWKPGQTGNLVVADWWAEKEGYV